MAESSTITQPVADFVEMSVSAAMLAAQGHAEYLRVALRTAVEQYAKVAASPADKQSLALFMRSMTNAAATEGYEQRATNYAKAALEAAKQSA